MRLRYFGLVALLLTLTACGQAIPAASGELLVEITATQVETPPLPSPTPSMTATSTPTVTPSPVPDTPTSTPAPIQTATQTQVSEPVATETATYPPPPDEVNVPILMYHYVSELPTNADSYRLDLTVPPAQFKSQLQYLRDQNYNTIQLVDIYETLTTGKPLPENPIVLTFDDGYKDAYTHVLPMLQVYGFTAEFFVLATPAHYEAPQYLNWNDIRMMAEAGMSMQAHGRDHYDLTNRDYDFLVYQILGAKEAVEAHANLPVTFFCYPSGRYDNDTQAVVASAGYLGAVTTEWGATQRLDNRYAWPRIRIKGAWSLNTYTTILESFKN